MAFHHQTRWKNLKTISFYSSNRSNYYHRYKDRQAILRYGLVLQIYYQYFSKSFFRVSFWFLQRHLDNLSKHKLHSQTICILHNPCQLENELVLMEMDQTSMDFGQPGVNSSKLRPEFGVNSSKLRPEFAHKRN